MIAALLLALLQQAPAPERAATVRVRVSPEAPAVGEPISVELRVSAPQGTLVRFPVLPDTGTRIEPLDPRIISATTDGDGTEQVATYRLIAWDTGSVAVAFGDVTLERDGRVTRYPVLTPSLRIRSVLPADTAQRRPRPPRDALDADTMPWRWLVAFVVLAALAWWGSKRARAHREALAARDPGAITRARDGFAHLRRLDLLSAGEVGRHLLAHIAVLRRYLGERWSELPPSLTAQELEARLPTLEFPLLPERLVAVVAAAEPVAYARAPLAPDAAQRLCLEAQEIVEDLERAWMARQARLQAESARIRRKKLR